jgi:hypothetical protein
VRHGTTLSRCDVPGGGVLDPAQCRDEAIVAATTKGGGFARPTRIELIGWLGNERHDGYTDRLETFGYHENKSLGPIAGAQLGVYRRVLERLWVGGIASTHELPGWTRDENDAPSDLHLDWSQHLIAAAARGEVPVLSNVKAYAQLGAGLGLGHTAFTDQNGAVTRQWHVGPGLTAGAGFVIGGDEDNTYFKGFGITGGYFYEYVPAISNLIGDTHGAGGHRVALGALYSF